MARELWTVGGNQGEGEASFTDDGSGVVSLSFNGVQILTEQQTTIADPSGGSTVDTEARTAIDAIIDALQAHGLIA